MVGKTRQIELGGGGGAHKKCKINKAFEGTVEGRPVMDIQKGEQKEMVDMGEGKPEVGKRRLGVGHHPQALLAGGISIFLLRST